jgi:NAD-dependent deacetylase
VGDALVGILREAEQLLVFTGAGISTGSGIRDFRGPQGVWKTRQPVYFDDFLSSEAARIEYWDQKLEAWPSFRDARPNAVHEAVVALERAGRVDTVVTQNIDGLHRRAGTSRERLVELHGTGSEVECLSCGARSDPGPHMESFASTKRPPTCACGGLLKPATISFGQALRPDDLRRAARAAARCDLVLALGSTLSVYPASSFPLAAAQRRVPYVIVNRGPTEHDGHPALTLRLEGDVALIFPKAVGAALSEATKG